MSGQHEVEQAREAVARETASVEDIDRQSDEIVARLAELETRRRGLAHAAITGDEAAAKELEKVDAEAWSLGRRQGHLHLAREEAGRRLIEAEAAREAAELRHRQEQAAELLGEAAKRAQEIDRHMAALAKALGEVDDLMDRAYKLDDGISRSHPNTYLRDWRQGAETFHGLLPLHSVNTAHMRPFADVVTERRATRADGTPGIGLEDAA